MDVNQMITGAEGVLNSVVSIAILLFEFMGVLVLLLTGIVGICNYFRRDPFCRLKLAKGMAMGLEFKLGSEILRTVAVRELQEIAIVGAIILLRAALTFLIHWEIKEEELSHNGGEVVAAPSYPEWHWPWRKTGK